MAFSAMQPKRSLEEFLNTICQKQTSKRTPQGPAPAIDFKGERMGRLKPDVIKD
jgi:hypothetical protein